MKKHMHIINLHLWCVQFRVYVGSIAINNCNCTDPPLTGDPLATRTQRTDHTGQQGGSGPGRFKRCWSWLYHQNHHIPTPPLFINNNKYIVNIINYWIPIHHLIHLRIGSNSFSLFWPPSAAPPRSQLPQHHAVRICLVAMEIRRPLPSRTRAPGRGKVGTPLDLAEEMVGENWKIWRFGDGPFQYTYMQIKQME